MLKNAYPRMLSSTPSGQAVRRPGPVLTWLMRIFIRGLPRRIG